MDIDVELQRDASLRAAVGSVVKTDGSGQVAVAILDADWMAAGRGTSVDPADPVAQMAAHLAVNEPTGEPPWPNVPTNSGADLYRVDSVYFSRADQLLSD